MADQPWKGEGMTKAEWVAREVARAVNAGKEWDLDTVDFVDPLRPLTCLEVDFPIIPVNELAKVEASSGAAKKPIYLAGKWFARRQPSVFRTLLLAAATKAPDDPAEAAKAVWDVYYGNHQARGVFRHLRVADIFMGGGTTVVEGSRLGMQMFGNDLNPVAWFVVKNEMAQIDRAEVEALLAEIEREVKPQIMPFYACDCPRGHKGKWTRLSDGQGMGDDFDATALSPNERKGYRYKGPEVIYVFWAKHGPCQVTGCGHRTPIMTSPVMAVKTLSVKTWSRRCKHCGDVYDLEERDARMAPGVPLVIAESERPFAVATFDKWGQVASAKCPLCGKIDPIDKLPKALGKGQNKKVDLTLLVHPDWLGGQASRDDQGRPYGGSADDDIEATVRWNNARAATCRLVEVRGKLPDEVTCPETDVTFQTADDGGNRPGRGLFACGACGASASFTDAVHQSGKTAPDGMYAIQGYCPECAAEGQAYNGRFFVPIRDASSFNAALREWSARKHADLAPFWPKSEIAFGHETHQRQPLPQRGFTHWWKLFNPRQLLAHAQVMHALERSPCSDSVKEGLLTILPQVLRANCMFCFWNTAQDCLEPFLGSTNFHPKSTVVENCVFQRDIGRGNLTSYSGTYLDLLEFQRTPWDLLSNARLPPGLAEIVQGKTTKLQMADGVRGEDSCVVCRSSTDLEHIQSDSCDLIISDPPFGDNIQYSELADFFYVWLRLALKDKYPEYQASGKRA